MQTLPGRPLRSSHGSLGSGGLFREARANAAISSLQMDPSPGCMRQLAILIGDFRLAGENVRRFNMNAPCGRSAVDNKLLHTSGSSPVRTRCFLKLVSMKDGWQGSRRTNTDSMDGVRARHSLHHLREILKANLVKCARLITCNSTFQSPMVSVGGVRGFMHSKKVSFVAHTSFVSCRYQCSAWAPASRLVDALWERHVEPAGLS